MHEYPIVPLELQIENGMELEEYVVFMPHGKVSELFSSKREAEFFVKCQQVYQ